MRQECGNTLRASGRAVGYDALKRLVDLMISISLAILLAPFLLAIALCVVATSPGSVLFRQIRIGRHGKPFRVYKFRTMVADAEKGGPQITSCDDHRVTPLGRFLRNTKIDEFPQLLNVIRGDMSLVGPRPQVPRFAQRFTPEYRDLIFSARPGVTGPTQLHFRYEEEMLAGVEDPEAYYIQTLLPTKCEMDAEYVRNASLIIDLEVAGRTAWIFARALVKRLLPFRHRVVPQTDMAVNYDD